jgi:plastocyanin
VRGDVVSASWPCSAPWYVAAVLLLGLSTGHKVGLALAAAGFTAFSLVASMLVPRWRPQFPGRGLPVFVAACVLIFAGMLTAVVVFGRESESKAEAAGRTVKVSEVDYKIKLPQTKFAPGTYTFEVANDGKVPHNLTVDGPGGKEATPDLAAGKSGSLTVELKAGSYDFFCSIPGHKQLGMDEKVTVS